MTEPQRMAALATLPVFFKLRGRRVVLAGGNAAAAWKVELIAAAGAAIDVFCVTPDDEFAETIAALGTAVTLHVRDWTPADLDGAALAIGAFDDDPPAALFRDAARAAGIPFNVIDRPDFCSFQFGAIVNRSPLVVAISTDGGAPVFAQGIRSRIEAMLPETFRHWAEAAKSWRRQGDRLGATMSDRRRFWESFTDLALASGGREPHGDDLERLIAGVAVPAGSVRGFVSLVGAGPGDPELLTLKAVRALRTADVVLYDDLVTEPILDFARREAKRMLVGKTGYGPACKQTEINSLMVRLALEGRRVVRLKSGDPMIFGRGGEEMDELTAAGIPFEVVPGISAVQAAAASLKVSLTHRDHAKRLQLVTGHSREGRLPSNLDWNALADGQATTAVYMAHRTLRELRQKLTDAGLDPATPAVAIVAASRPAERIIRATIATLPDALDAAKISGPCLVVFGAVLAASPADAIEAVALPAE